MSSKSLEDSRLSIDTTTGCYTSTDYLDSFCKSYLPAHMADEDIADQVNCLLDVSAGMEIMPDAETQRLARRIKSRSRNAWRSALKAEAAELSARGRYPVRWRDLRVDTGPGGYAVRSSIQHIHNHVMMRYDIAGPRRITGDW